LAALFLLGSATGARAVETYVPEQIAAFDGLSMGSGPQSLIQAADGMLYGTASGGRQTDGLIFRIDPVDSTFSVVFEFDGETSGEHPLLQSADGSFYVATVPSYSPGFSGGTIFKLNPDGAGVTTILDFAPATTGIECSGMLEGDDGLIYAATRTGGADGAGTVFRIRTLHLPALSSVTPPRRPAGDSGFTLTVDGEDFFEGAVVLWDGAELATTFVSGSQLLASVPRPQHTSELYPARVAVRNPDGHTTEEWELAPAQEELTYQLLRSFDDPATGTYIGQVVQGSDGTLYGTTEEGGSAGVGTLFRMNPDGSGFATVFHFDDITTGERPWHLTMASDGALYGSAQEGDLGGAGTVYQFDPGSETFAVLRAFSYDTHPFYEPAGLMEASNGVLYGVARGGGIFRLNKEGTAFASLHDLDSAGSFPWYALTEGGDGRLYGATSSGGAFGGGSIFVIG
jgi:uncharacterized repeat protein (TIGR03803 family)